jgi:serine/threonine protein kinase
MAWAHHADPCIMPPMQRALKRGRVVAGRFRIESVIGEGGMGTVYLASHVTLHRKYAIKVLKSDFVADQTYVERFRREAIAASRVVHPNVVYITDFGQLDEGSFYIVMEHLIGYGLDELLDTRGAQPLSRILPMLIHLSDALDYAGSLGVVHRDIKPENIMLCEVRGHKDVVKLVDFGIAKVVAEGIASQRITMRGQIFGTPEYISPEQAMDAEVDIRSDVYSLGIIAYELATGEPPFTGNPASILRDHVQKPVEAPSARMPRQPIPPGFDGIVLRCLAKRPDDRYQTAGALCRDLMKLRGFLAGMADDLLQPSDPKRTRPHKLTTSGAWSTLTTARQPLVGMLDVDPPEVAPLPGAGEETRRFVKLAVSSRDLRQELHKTLRELAFSLSESSIRTAELSPVLSRLLQLEEEGRALGGKISVLEQNYDRIRFDFGEQETMLRYAALDLRVLYHQALDAAQRAGGDAAPTQADDLRYQVEALEQRIEEVGDERTARITGLNQEIQGYRQAQAEREEETARLYTELHGLLEGVRAQATAGNLPALYRQLDDLSQQLQLARQSVRFMRR